MSDQEDEATTSKVAADQPVKQAQLNPQKALNPVEKFQQMTEAEKAFTINNIYKKCDREEQLDSFDFEILELNKKLKPKGAIKLDDKDSILSYIKIKLPRLPKIETNEIRFDLMSETQLDHAILLIRQYITFEPFSLKKKIKPVGEKEDISYSIRQTFINVSLKNWARFITDLTGNSDYIDEFNQWRRDEKQNLLNPITSIKKKYNP